MFKLKIANDILEKDRMSYSCGRRIHKTPAQTLKNIDKILKSLFDDGYDYQGFIDGYLIFKRV